jgi:hypothetical protein
MRVVAEACWGCSARVQATTAMVIFERWCVRVGDGALVCGGWNLWWRWTVVARDD